MKMNQKKRTELHRSKNNEFIRRMATKMKATLTVVLKKLPERSSALFQQDGYVSLSCNRVQDIISFAKQPLYISLHGQEPGVSAVLAHQHSLDSS